MHRFYSGHFFSAMQKGPAPRVCKPRTALLLSIMYTCTDVWGGGHCIYSCTSGVKYFYIRISKKVVMVSFARSVLQANIPEERKKREKFSVCEKPATREYKAECCVQYVCLRERYKSSSCEANKLQVKPACFKASFLPNQNGSSKITSITSKVLPPNEKSKG